MPNTPAPTADRLIGVSTNDKFVMTWQSPDKPCPTLTTGPCNTSGYLLIEHEEAADG